MRRAIIAFGVLAVIGGVLGIIGGVLSVIDGDKQGWIAVVCGFGVFVVVLVVRRHLKESRWI